MKYGSKMNNKAVNYSELFDLSDPLANQPYRLSPVNEQDKWLDQDKIFLMFQGKWQPPEPVILKPVMGGRPMDILWSGCPPIMTVSQRIIDILLDYRFKGWATYPVQVYDKHEKLLPGYYGFAVKSSVGKPDLKRSKIITRTLVEGGKPAEFYQGFYFNEDNWDGSAIFRIDAAHIVVTGPVKEVLKRKK